MFGFLSDHTDKLSGMRIGAFAGWHYAGKLASMHAMRIWKDPDLVLAYHRVTCGCASVRR